MYRLTLDDGKAYNKLSFDFPTIPAMNEFLLVAMKRSVKILKATVEIIAEESEEE